MATLQIWFEASRPKTLPAAVAPVVLGTAMAHSDGQLHLVPATICLAFALLVQIGTNFANDYLDSIKGTDTDARLGPRRAVAAGLVSASTMRWAAIVILAFAFCLGLSLIHFGGWSLLAVGISSVLCAWFYTGGPYPLAYNGMGDVFVVLFFGLIAVGCTYFVQAGFVSHEVILLGLSCGLVINNILVVNNYRDIDEDIRANKRTLVVLLGRRWALVQYGLSLIFAGGILSWL
ncbi:MAG: 1,4-dihydroxy-2-naphthoate polyprenyltransferase, partial [Verrucomicrobiota bacterium]|nr:1,4-dihydroxy-2-naphthoate polyprenyltransferase [Verrucomicrobiota bacterium]